MDPIYYLLGIFFLLVLGYVLWHNKLKPKSHQSQLLAELSSRQDWPQLQKIKQLFDTLYSGVDTYYTSVIARERLGISEDAFIYGEIEFYPFFSLLDKVKPKTGEVFYDLGSGAGKAVFAAALNYDLAKAYGIEFISDLYELANAEAKKAASLIQTKCQEKSKLYLRRLASIKFINDNFLNHDFSDADIVYISATCLSYLTWEKILERMSQLKIGSRVIVGTKKIQDEKFKIICQTTELMSWGMNSVNIYEKIN